MAQFVLNLPDGQLQRLAAAVAQQRGVTPVELAAMTNAQKGAMVKEHIRVFLVNTVQSSEVPAATQAASDAKIAEITSGITVT